MPRRPGPGCQVLVTMLTRVAGLRPVRLSLAPSPRRLPAAKLTLWIQAGLAPLPLRNPLPLMVEGVKWLLYWWPAPTASRSQPDPLTLLPFATSDWMDFWGEAMPTLELTAST